MDRGPIIGQGRKAAFTVVVMLPSIGVVLYHNLGLDGGPKFPGAVHSFLHF